MPEFRLTKKEEENLKTQFERWKKILNWKIAPIAYAAVIAAISAPEYSTLSGVVGIFVIAGAYIVARHEFPKVFSKLKSKPDRTFREEIILRGVASYYFSLISMIKHFALYLFSGTLLVLVVAGVLKKFRL